MTTAASAAAILPRVHAALMREPEMIWRSADRHTRLLWCSLSHVDSEAFPPVPWEQLPTFATQRLTHHLGVYFSLLYNLALSDLAD